MLQDSFCIRKTAPAPTGTVFKNDNRIAKFGKALDTLARVPEMMDAPPIL